MPVGDEALAFLFDPLVFLPNGEGSVRTSEGDAGKTKFAGVSVVAPNEQNTSVNHN